MSLFETCILSALSLTRQSTSLLASRLAYHSAIGFSRQLSMAHLRVIYYPASVT